MGLCVKKTMYIHTLIKNTLLIKNADHHLTTWGSINLQFVGGKKKENTVSAKHNKDMHNTTRYAYVFQQITWGKKYRLWSDS